MVINFLQQYYRIDRQERMISMCNRIQGTTTMTGLIGYPIKESKSPHMHNSAFKKLGLDYVYLPFETEKGAIKEALDAMRLFNVRGFNITMPHKEDVIEYLDELTEEVKIIGSVNTVVNDNGKLIGHNTDGKGFAKALKLDGVNFEGKKVVVVGAGGAAKSIAIQLAFDGAVEVVIMNRTLEKAKDIANRINKNIPDCKSRALGLDESVLKEELKDSTLLVDCTPVGTNDTLGESIVNNLDTFHKDLFVANIVYSPIKTKFLSMAEDMGCRNSNGIGMLIYQGELAFKLWTGKDMPVEYIKEILFNR